jgi:hypothetical protein
MSCKGNDKYVYRITQPDPKLNRPALNNSPYAISLCAPRCPHGDKSPCYYYEAACGGSACEAGFVIVAPTFTSGLADDSAEIVKEVFA